MEINSVESWHRRLVSAITDHLIYPNRSPQVSIQTMPDVSMFCPGSGTKQAH